MQIDSQPRCFALVPCAGSGQRAGPGGPKQYRQVAGRPVVAWTLAALQQVRRIQATLVVLSADDDRFELQVPGFAGERGWVARVGGASRAESVLNGLQVLVEQGAQPQDWVLVHDAARCLIQAAWVDTLIDACWDEEVGGLLALPLADTLKQDAGRFADRPAVAATLDRSGKWAAQTPQMFRLGLLLPALRQVLTQIPVSEGKELTDESGAVEALGHCPRLIVGAWDNFKLTWPQDFDLASRLLQARQGEPGRRGAGGIRIGEGWDVHALVLGRPLVLGGVRIDHSHGLLGHSDADALLHAITDAVLGAAGLGDIGRHFPDTDERFRGADSRLLLAEAMRGVRAAGWDLVNLDATIVAQAPKMAPHIEAMRESIAGCLGVAVTQVNVKAKTAEKMGPVGEGRAIEARAVCLLQWV